MEENSTKTSMSQKEENIKGNISCENSKLGTYKGDRKRIKACWHKSWNLTRICRAKVKEDGPQLYNVYLIS